MGCNVQRKITTARRAFRAAVWSLRRCWNKLVSRLDRAVRSWRLGESEADGQNTTNEREAA